MPQMSPIQWTWFFHTFIGILIMSSIMINFISIYYKKSPIYNKINSINSSLKW